MSDYTKEELSRQVRYLRFLLGRATGTMPLEILRETTHFLGGVPGPDSNLALDDVHKLKQAAALGSAEYAKAAISVGMIH